MRKQIYFIEVVFVMLVGIALVGIVLALIQGVISLVACLV